ncbi:putative LPS assembly protein LptD [Blattabacterium cuenoti]|uniref:putative LPS assembly protein LptD n=1 Tax=Blattabacterium cuenoti TaxID=1653831 RepID=UPI001EEBFE4F|nr:putative LPS assembly protein LptD [Blattabacterium cuenoti]
MYQTKFFVYIILFIFSISIFYGNEKNDYDDVILYNNYNHHKMKNNLSFLKDILKYKSHIQEHDIKEGKSYLKGKASIEYNNTKIEADYIEYNWKNGDLYASSKEEKSVFLQKDDHKYFFSQIHFNLENKMGEAKNFYIKEKNYIVRANEVFKKKEDILMKKITYISDPFFLKKKDSFPDFYLKTNYLKYSYLKKYIFSGPIFFYWYRVPMPIFIPFLYMPIELNKTSYRAVYPKLGIQNKKIYMEDLGLFFPISNFINFMMSTSIYNIEKWKIKTRIEYKLKHAYSGSIDFDYQNMSDKQKNYLFQWKHNSDFKSNSEINFNANINYDNILYNKNENFSYINVRKKLSNYLLFMDAYMIQKHDKKRIKFIIPELILHTNNILFNDKKNFFLNRVNIENRLQFKNSIDFNKKITPVFNHNMCITAYFPFFYPYLRISSKILYKDFYIWNYPYFDVSSFQNIDLSTNIVSIPFYKIWYLKNTILLKHKIKSVLSFQMIYFPPVFYNKKNPFEKRINLILNNDWEIKNRRNHVDIYKKTEIIKEINTSFIIDHNFIKWENFYIIGNTDLTKNLEAKYKAGINFGKKEKNMIYFDFSFYSNYEINFFSKKNLFQKKGKNRYDYFFFDQKNYARYPIPFNLKIDFHSNYENCFNKQKFFHTFLNINGSVNITKYWKISFNTDYDFLKNQIIFTNIIFDRDLRSFEMSFNWTLIKNPSWSFFIGLKDPNFNKIVQYNEKS